jgi:hypothetical protein
VMAQNLRRGFDTVQARQPDVHQHHSGAEALHELHSIGARLGLAYYSELPASAENGLDAVPHDLVILYEEYIEWHIQVQTIVQRLEGFEPVKLTGSRGPERPEDEYVENTGVYRK